MSKTEFWIAFHVVIGFCLFADLFLFHRKSHTVSMKEAGITSAFWVGFALIFAAGIGWYRGANDAVTFLAAYLLEESLSMDNLFVFYLLFRHFNIPKEGEHKLLFYGVMGAIIMRATFILVGVQLVKQFQFLFYFFGAFLLYSGIKMWNHTEEEEESKIIKVLSKILPVSKGSHTGFFVVENGKRMLTTGAFALIAIEVSDLLFALDSIPAVLGITQDFFIAYTSNIFAILGLRSLYFLLAGLIQQFRRLHYGLSFALMFIGVKMLIVNFLHIPVGLSLAIIILAVATPIWLDLRENKKNGIPKLEA